MHLPNLWFHFPKLPNISFHLGNRTRPGVSGHYDCYGLLRTNLLQACQSSQIMSLFSASPPTVIPSGFRWSCRIFVKEACPNIEFILGFQEVIQFYAQTSLNLEEFKSMSSNIFTSADSNLRAGSSSVHLVHWG